MITGPAIREAAGSVVKVAGAARACQRLYATGFVVAPERVMTTAHQVAGTTGPVHVFPADGRSVAGTVVLFDPGRDVAVIWAPGLGVAPLRFGPTASPGDSGIIIGYSRDRGLRQIPATITSISTVAGPDLFHQHTAHREIQTLRATIDEAESGGPVISASGVVSGMVFAVALDADNQSYALTARELVTDVANGATATAAVSTHGCPF